MLVDGKKISELKCTERLGEYIVQKGGPDISSKTMGSWIQEGKKLAQDEELRFQELEKRGGSLNTGNDSMSPIPKHITSWHALMESYKDLMKRKSSQDAIKSGRCNLPQKTEAEAFEEDVEASGKEDEQVIEIVSSVQHDSARLMTTKAQDESTKRKRKTNNDSAGLSVPFKARNKQVGYGSDISGPMVSVGKRLQTQLRLFFQ